MSDRDTAALRDSVIEQMARASYELYASQMGAATRAALGVNRSWDELPEWHREDGRARAAVMLDAALAVTACTTCGDGPRRGDPCPVCHGTPPRALRWASEEPQYERVGWLSKGLDPKSEIALGERFAKAAAHHGWLPVFVLTERNEQEGA